MIILKYLYTILITHTKVILLNYLSIKLKKFRIILIFFEKKVLFYTLKMSCNIELTPIESYHWLIIFASYITLSISAC